MIYQLLLFTKETLHFDVDYKGLSQLPIKFFSKNNISKWC